MFHSRWQDWQDKEAPVKQKPPFVPNDRQAVFLDSIDHEIELIDAKIDAEIALARAQRAKVEAG